MEKDTDTSKPISERVGVTDSPLDDLDDDKLEVAHYATALAEFVKKAVTPMTIAIQGQWGMGKTTFLNQVHSQLKPRKEQVETETTEGAKSILNIKLDAWDYALFNGPEEALRQIIHKLSVRISEGDRKQSRKKKIINSTTSLARKASLLGLGFLPGMGNNKLLEGLDIIKDADSQHVLDLKENLKSSVAELDSRETNSYERIVIYLDNLDRIKPEVAVEILDSLKIIFDLQKCVFLLAIDYDVVIKGLEKRFGVKRGENQREFRAYFDKIIQLPFNVPNEKFRIGSYVKGLLKDINYKKSDEFEVGYLENIVKSTIGENPRSIKRLVNSLSLYQIIDRNEGQEKPKSLEEQYLRFGLTCLQISDRNIYDTLQRNSDFLSWDESFSSDVTYIKETEEKEFSAALKNLEEAGDVNKAWQVSLFKVCYADVELRERHQEIAKFFDEVVEIYEKKEKALKAHMEDALKSTEVTKMSVRKKRNYHSPEKKKAAARRLQELGNTHQNRVQVGREFNAHATSIGQWYEKHGKKTK